MHSSSHGQKHSRLSRWSGKLQHVFGGGKHGYGFVSPEAEPQIRRAFASPTSTRVLLLHSGDAQDDIYCELRHIDLADPQHLEFEALSYVWGDSADRSPILVNDWAFFVTTNLKLALWHLRYPRGYAPRVLWVDAVCINQDDLEERSQQVQIMTQIYAGAVRVLAWLGDAGEDGLLISRVCERLEPQIGTVSLGDRLLHAQRRAIVLAAPDLGKTADILDEAVANGWQQQTEESLRAAISPDKFEVLRKAMETRNDPAYPNSAEYHAIMRLLHRPWFRRIWIVQEATVAKELVIYLGPYTANWDAFVFAVYSCSQLSSASSIHRRQALTRLAEARHLVQTHSPVAFANLLRAFRICQASEPRDKIYALLGVTTEKIDIECKYEVPLISLFGRATIKCITLAGNLDALSTSLRSQPRTEGFPSWVHDWADNGLHPRDMLYWEDKRVLNPGHHGRFSATGTSGAGTLRVDTEHKISLRGYVFDKLAHLSAPCTFSAVDNAEKLSVTLNGKAGFDKMVGPLTEMVDGVRSMIEELLAIGEMVKLLENGNEPYAFVESDTVQDAFMLTMTLNHPIEGIEQARQDIRAFCKSIQSPEMMQFLHAQRMAGEQEMTYLMRLVKAILADIASIQGFLGTCATSRYRRFAITEAGMYALVPTSSVVGDSLMLLQGGKVPFAMRPHGSLGGTWEMLGDAYVHGVMNGEAYDGSSCETIVVT